MLVYQAIGNPGSVTPDGEVYHPDTLAHFLAVVEISQLRRLRELEDENRKLKQVVADLTLDNRALKDLATKNW